MSDEEAGGDYGARYVVERHAELFDGVRYAIGEFGGFTMEIAGRRFYPMMVAEKQLCSLRATLRGPTGHGSLPVRSGAMGRLGHLLAALDHGRLRVHVTPAARAMIEAIAAEAPPATRIPQIRCHWSTSWRLRAAPSIAPKRVTKLSKRENTPDYGERRKRWLRSAS